MYFSSENNNLFEGLTTLETIKSNNVYRLLNQIQEAAQNQQFELINNIFKQRLKMRTVRGSPCRA